jgi:heterodisulfide reductase subunit C
MVDTGFRSEVENIYGGQVTCLQCATCSGGCPVAYAMDYTPREVIRMVQLGLRDDALSCSSIWICSSCNTCYTRCPGGVEIPEIMTTLRSIAIKEAVAEEEHRERNFYKAFSKTVAEHGRLFEPELAIRYDLSVGFGRLLNDTPIALKMLRHHKLSLLPKRIRNPRKVSRMMERIREKGDFA